MVLSTGTFNQSLRTEYSEAVNALYTFQLLWVSDKTNLVPRVLGLFGQRESARRDSGIIDLNHIFDWPLA